jgi:hypothetical protein
MQPIGKENQSGRQMVDSFTQWYYSKYESKVIL